MSRYGPDLDWDELDPEGPSAEDIERFDRDDPDEDLWEESEPTKTKWWIPLTAITVLVAFLLILF